MQILTANVFWRLYFAIFPTGNTQGPTPTDGELDGVGTVEEETASVTEKKNKQTKMEIKKDNEVCLRPSKL